MGSDPPVQKTMNRCTAPPSHRGDRRHLNRLDSGQYRPNWRHLLRFHCEFQDPVQVRISEFVATDIRRDLSNHRRRHHRLHRWGRLGLVTNHSHRGMFAQSSGGIGFPNHRAFRPGPYRYWSDRWCGRYHRLPLNLTNL